MAEYAVDSLGLLLGQDCVINENIAIHQPTIREVIEFGEREYFGGLVGLLTSIPSELKSFLWDCGVDYEKMSDFELFCVLAPTIPQSSSKLLFGDKLNFQEMVLLQDDVGETVLYDPSSDITINPYLHHKIFQTLCAMHHISKIGKRDKAGTALTKKMLIQFDREDRLRQTNKPFVSVLHSSISAMVNSAGFKYNHFEIMDITLYQLFDSVARIQIITSTLALLQGSYSGFCDTSKIDKNLFNWLRDVDKK